MAIVGAFGSKYLLSAYRTLNRVGHGERTADQLKGLETAIADEFLLGNERQIQLARQFSDDFAQSGDGDVAGPLEDLRIDLRRESLLGDAGARTTWLWVEPGTAWIAAEAMVVANLAEADQRSARSTLQGYTERSQQGDGSKTLRDIEDAYARLASLVVELVPEVSDGKADPVMEASRDGHLSEQSSKTLEGLSIMYQLAISDSQRVSQDRRNEFLMLANAARYVLRNEVR